MDVADEEVRLVEGHLFSVRVFLKTFNAMNWGRGISQFIVNDRRLVWVFEFKMGKLVVSDKTVQKIQQETIPSSYSLQTLTNVCSIGVRTRA